MNPSPHWTPVSMLLGMGLFAAACATDNSFTKLSDPEPPAEDTSAPPIEVAEEVIPEPTPECAERIYPGLETTFREDCLIEPPESRFEAVVEWVKSDFDLLPEYSGYGRPSVGNLTDDNGDGVVDEFDVPDIVFPSGGPIPYGCYPILRAISGDGGEEHWAAGRYTVDGRMFTVLNWSTPALGDVDLDGDPEIVVMMGPMDQFNDADYASFCPGSGSYVHSGVSDCALGVISAEGELEGFVHGLTCESHSPAVMDIQSDGIPDILLDMRVFQGTDLTELTVTDVSGRGRGSSWSYWTGGVPTPVDLEGDGLMEVVTGTHIQEWDGTLRCTTGLSDQWAAVADLDGDGDGELVLTGDGDVILADHNCIVLNSWPLEDDGRGGPATIADYDGDGLPEIGLPSERLYSVYETDGTLKWTSPATDHSSNCTGSSVFDFEADGYAEVVYADETDLWVISGFSGRPVLRYSGHSSGTENEYPLIVDVDGDGETEIVHFGGLGVYAIGSVDGWAPSRPVWNQHAYWLTNINDDLTIPSPTPQNWPEYNSFRSGDLRVNAGQGARLVDAKPFVHDICEIECSEGTVQVALSPNNEGLADAVDGVNLAIYAEQTDGSRVLIEALSAEDLHRAGYATEGVVLELAMTDLPTGTLILVADDDGTGTGVIEECDETNNELRLEGLCADE